MSERFRKVLCYEDKRGAIRKHEDFGLKFNIVTSKKGTFRAGDEHPNVQHNMIISGKVKVTRHVGGYDLPSVYQSQAVFFTLPGVPHLFEFLEDTIMVEFWNGPFSMEYFPPYRKIVDESMK